MNRHPVILVNPGEIPLSDALGKNKHSGIYMYPYSLLFLQNYLLTKNIESFIVDLYCQKSEELFKAIRDSINPIIGVTAQPHSVLKALEIIKQIKAIKHDSIVVAGGNFFSNTHKDVLARFNEIDVVVRGEGEITFYELVDSILRNIEFDNIDGITYRNNNNIIENRNRRTERDIEKFQLQYYKLPLVERFREGILMRNYEKENYRSFPVFLGRGCSRKCVFCEYNQFPYRFRKIPDIIQEIDYLIKNFNARYFTLADPSFCERKDFVKEFCEELIKKLPDIRWSCEARVDTPNELLELMAKAGCINIDFGLESGSEKVLKAINKNIDIHKTFEFVKKCHSLRIRTHMFLMVSLPEETEEDAMQTFNFCSELSKYVTSMSLAVTQILPGTELEIIASRKGLLPEDFSYYDERFYHKYLQFGDPHIPLYFEHLDIGFIESFFTKMMDLRATKYDSYGELIMMAKSGILSMHKRTFKKNLVYIRRFLVAILGKLIK